MNRLSSKITYKKITAIFFSFFILAALFLAGVGNYFVNYALMPSTERGDEVTPSADPTMSIEDLAAIEANRIWIDKQKEAWIADVSKEIVEITSSDGLKLAADHFYPKNTSHKWVILVHGYGSKRQNVQRIASFYGLKDFHVLTPDMRAQGESEGTFTGMGWLERKDMLLWIEQALAMDPEAQIILHGVSMGAATVMMTSGEPLPSNVKAVIEDCGYTSAWDIFADELDYLFHLPPFPVLHASNAMTKIRAGFDLKEASALKQVKKSQTPILFIHGNKDSFVNPDMVDILYSSASCEKEKMIISGAGHVEAYLREPELYFNTVFRFIDLYLDTNAL